MIKIKTVKKGFSLVEILVVVSIFAALGIIVSRSVISTLKNARKSDSQINVRENLNYALSVMEVNLRGSESISTCPTSGTTLTYTTFENETSTFSCLFPGGDGYVASGSARLTSEDVLVTNCSFTCLKENENSPYVVDLSVSAEDTNNKGAEGSSVTVNTEIVLRNY